MVKMEINGDMIQKIDVAGTPQKILIELLGGIAAIYQMFRSDDEEIAQIFREALQYGVRDDAPVWDPKTFPKEPGEFVKIHFGSRYPQKGDNQNA